MQGWIKLYRKLLDSDMWKNLNSDQKNMMMAVLLMANHEPKKWEWQGNVYQVKSGQFITSLSSLSQITRLSIQSTRTALKKLEKWKFLTNQSTKTGRLITIVKWEEYQREDVTPNKDINKQLTKSQHRANTELTPNKNDKNNKKDKNDKKLKKTYSPENFMEDYNSICTNLPKCAKLNNSRRTKIKIRLKENIDKKVTEREFWITVFRKTNETPFLRGSSNSNWQANLDWLIANDTNYLKVIEGNYDKVIQPSVQARLKRLRENKGR